VQEGEEPGRYIYEPKEQPKEQKRKEKPKGKQRGGGISLPQFALWDAYV
jgi:hypothetical protein